MLLTILSFSCLLYRYDAEIGKIEGGSWCSLIIMNFERLAVNLICPTNVEGKLEADGKVSGGEQTHFFQISTNKGLLELTLCAACDLK